MAGSPTRVHHDVYHLKNLRGTEHRLLRSGHFPDTAQTLSRNSIDRAGPISHLGPSRVHDSRKAYLLKMSTVT